MANLPRGLTSPYYQSLTASPTCFSQGSHDPVEAATGRASITLPEDYGGKRHPSVNNSLSQIVHFIHISSAFTLIMSKSDTNQDQEQSQAGLLSGVTGLVGGVVGTAGKAVGGVTSTAGNVVQTVGEGAGETVKGVSSGLGDATSEFSHFDYSHFELELIVLIFYPM